jgi:TolB-like protein/tRNA A-37 threonylcarbamoyl transferase component Bud32/Flp pilus assembly protein TadD
MIGQMASHYRVLERLGTGGMGEVYLAQDVRRSRPVALKMLRSEANDDEAARARLLREARAASALNHPNIAVIYEVDELVGAEGPSRFIAMEYVAGKTLGQLGRESPLSLDQVLDIARQVADGLGEAHARGVIHRDVKPSNVMVTESGRVKVLDFGLAKQALLPHDPETTWSHDPLADAGALVGTLAYMSPEQALGQEIDGRADVFSLGVVLYELLAGQAPFAGKNAVQLLDRILHHDPPPLVFRIADPRLPLVEAVIRRMLDRDRDHRHPDMQAVAEDLAAVQRGSQPAAKPLASDERSVAVLSFVNITGNGEDDWLGTGIAETVTADLKSALGLAVIARERVHEMRRRLAVPGDEDDAGLAVRVGRALGSRWVVSGGFQRAGETVRVTARLIEVGTGTIIDTVKIDGRVSEIFDVQDRVVRALSASLRTTPPAADPAPEETHVIEAYEAFSKGVLNLSRETYESLDRAVFLFERAVRLDPGYARAHLELGSAYAGKADYLVLPELYESALLSFHRAIERGPALVRAWREMGSVLVALGREDEGIEAIRRALELDPGDAGALGAMARAHFVGLALFREAAGWFEKALVQNPQAGWFALQLAHCLALVGDLEPAERMARRAVELQEAFLTGREGILIVGAFMRLGQVAALQGRHEEATSQFRSELAFIQRADHALRSRITIELHMRLGGAYQRLGSSSEAEAAFGTALQAFEERVRLGADDPFTRYYVGCIHALRGNADEALVCLEKAAAQRRRFTLARARLDPALEALRGLSRFRELTGDP